MSTAAFSMHTFKIWITLPGGEKVHHDAEDFELEKKCGWRDCGKSYFTKYREQEYCSYDCARSAANFRYKTKAE